MNRSIIQNSNINTIKCKVDQKTHKHDSLQHVVAKQHIWLEQKTSMKHTHYHYMHNDRVKRVSPQVYSAYSLRTSV